MLPSTEGPQSVRPENPGAPEPERELHSIAVVIPVYQGEKTLEAVVTEMEPLVRESATPRGRRFQVTEVTLVHDGAIDNSDQVMMALASRFAFLRLVWLSRNFGQHPATLAGMAATSADWIVTMDEDGQHNAQDIGRMLDVALEESAQLVYARPTNEPPHGWLRNRLSELAKWLFVRLLSGGVVGYFHSFRLLDGEIGRSLAAYCGHSVYLDVALGWVVARQAYCPVAVRTGIRRPSGYTFVNLARHFWRLVLTAGTRPLRFITLLGMCSFLLAIAIAAVAAYQKLTNQIEVPGWTSTIVVLSFFAGCILFSLGIIAEYLGVALTMSMGKPLYLVVSRPRRRKAAP
jgi:undecaprenyl-phosphate 4-deoxy-4-formamido-L-arabinose transferase